MTASVAIVADDLTGAADAGLGFCRGRLTTTVVWNAEPSSWPVDRVDVLAIDAGTRAMPADQAVACTRAIVGHVRDVGVPHLFKKIDSTLRGHVGDEIAATLSGWHPGVMAIVAPAFPAMGRTTRGGEQHVEGNPLRIGTIARLLERSGLRVDHADLGHVRSGMLHLKAEEAAARAVKALVCDAESDADLAAIAEAGASLGPRVVWVGTGGLAGCIPSAIALPTGPAAHGEIAIWGPVHPRPTLIVVGSRTSTAREQVRGLIAEGVRHVSVSAFAVADVLAKPALQARQEVAMTLGSEKDVLVSLADDDGTAREDHRLPFNVGNLLRPFCRSIGALVVTGGDTARGVLDAWGVSALHLVHEMQPGMPLAIGDGAMRLPVVTKAGGFGGPRTLVAAVERLRQLRSSSESIA
jgi:4-hydroxythreonine-4-phosphate dehydrogenase